MGSFCATEGFRASISRTASSLCGSSGIFYDQRPVEKSVVTRGSVSTSPKECIGRISGDSTFQNGDQQVDQNLSPYRDVDVFFRSDGCLFSCPYSSGLSEVSSSGLGGQGEQFRTDLGIVLPPEEKFLKLQYLLDQLLSAKQASARQFLQLIGFLISLMDIVPLGRLHIRPIQWYLLEFWVPASQQWEAVIPILPRLYPHLLWWSVRENVMIGCSLDPPVPSMTLFTDTSLTGWGATLEGREASGSISDDSHRQYNSSGLSAESGRHTFSVSLPSVQRNSVVLPFPGNSLVSQACSWQSESSSGCSLKVTASSEYRMGVTSSSLSGDLSQVGSSSYRPLCYASELQTANVCVSDSRQQSFSSGCNVFRLEGDVFLHVSSFSPPSQDFTQNQGRNLQDHSYCSSMAKTILVSRSSSTVLCETNSASSQERSFVSIQRQESSSESFQPPSTRMVTVRESLRQDGFSDRAAKRISSSVRKSTGAIYDSKWNIFCSWCRSKEIDPLAVTVQQLAEFLVYLFEDKGFSPSTIKGYRSALSRTIALSGGPDFGKNEFLSLMVKNFCLERPRQRRLVPSWNLALVLRTLQFPPFEPLFLASFKFLTLKCCFLLALASGRRRSEIHAFSIADSCLRFSADNSSVTLLTDPSFLAKNQLSDKGSGPIVIPALPKSLGNQDLCPVRTLQKYISVSSTLRPSGSTRLFIPIKKGLKDILAKTISTWLCHTVKMAYQSSSPEALSRVQVQAHEIRALSCSWAIFNSSSMSEIMSAGYWRSDSTFYNHYLRSMPLHSDSLFSLGPLVSAQKVVFPPSCQSQGDSALL
ncbi:uncharacterized protein LOC130049943 [Ostrea edulis]|uniref:uncharacterized protein LOC130049943 n=1 Tax=Ostrea edulis TaxID=37623 RepID=UPI0024AF62E4|nr:uncharacterized protein LOC130049943 [Ostrea edulis]